MKTRNANDKNARYYFKQQGGWSLVRRYARAGCLPLALNQLLALGGKQPGLEILRLSTQYRIREKLRRRYRQELQALVAHHSPNPSRGLKEEDKGVDYVWFCWLQGIHQAPEVVQKCYASAQKAYEGRRQVVLITEKNYRNYVTFPQEIQDKIARDVITGAHLADLIRLELLINYGGIWSDATVFYASRDLPDWLFKKELFAYQLLKPGRDGQALPMSNWLLVAPRLDRLLLITRDLLYSYWRDHDDLLDYYLFHAFFQLAVEACPKDWARVVPVDSSAPHQLGLRLFEPYDPRIWAAIARQTAIHKLSHKFPEEDFAKPATFYQQVVGQMKGACDD